MPQVPRIGRTEPSGNAIRPPQPLPVTMIWHDDSRNEVRAAAVAWTHREVEIEWTTPRPDVRRDWVWPNQVRRADGAPSLLPRS
jgi:hypothetical protein